MRKVFLLFSILIFLASRGGLKEVKLNQISNVSNFQKNGKMMTADVTLSILNENSFPIVVKPSQLDVLMNDRLIGIAYLNKKVKFNKKSTEDYIANVSFENQGIKIMDIIGAAFSGKMKLRFSGKVKAGNGVISKKFKVDEVKEFTTDDLLKWIK